MTRTDRLFGATACAALALLGGCSGSPRPVVPAGDVGYAAIRASEAPDLAAPYKIMPKDELALVVMGEAEISQPRLVVDEAGNVQVPVVGEIKAAGMTPRMLAEFITDTLSRRYLRNPSVTVSVTQPAPRIVAVEGNVRRPGVYSVDRKTTLLGALARAESPTDVARLSDVVIFRTVEGKRMGARFNVSHIRAGMAPDPLVTDGDVVVVGRSAIAALWQDFLKATPLLNIFVLASNNN